MKKKAVAIGMTLGLLIVWVAGTRLVQASVHEANHESRMASAIAYPDAQWVLSTIDGTRNVGEYVSLSIEPSSGQIFVSYYDQAGKDLYLAIYDGKKGDCGPGNTWHCHKLDSVGDVGKFNSIDTLGNPDGVEFGISYYDATNRGLKYISGFNQSSGFSWLASKVQSSAIITNRTGQYTSLKFNKNGIPYIAYNRSLLSSSKQMLAHFVGDGTGNCGEGDEAGQWQCDTVASGQGVGINAALDFDSAGHPVIAYYDANKNIPVVAGFDGTSWLLRDVKNGTDKTGRDVSLFVDNSNVAHIAYHNETKGTVEYASYVGSGGNCGYNSITLRSEWDCGEIEDVGAGSIPMGLSLVGDAHGLPVIAYQYGAEAQVQPAVKIARPKVAAGVSLYKTNCGPLFLGFHTWYCDYVDAGINTYTEEGSSVSVAMNSANLPVVAYQELDTYETPDKGRLKVAAQHLFLCLPLVAKSK